MDADCSNEPLSGRTLVITRPRHVLDSLRGKLERLGATVVPCPAIRIVFPSDAEVARLVEPGEPYTWIVFTSSNAVRSVAGLYAGGRFGGRVAVVGQATKREAESCGFKVDLVPEKATGKELGRRLSAVLGNRDRVLIPRSDKADDRLLKALEPSGAYLNAVVTYRTEAEDPSAGEALRSFIRSGRLPDGVLFASPSAVRGLEMVLGAGLFAELLRRAAVFSIGPSTSKALSSGGWPVAAEAQPHTEEGLLNAVVSFFEVAKG